MYIKQLKAWSQNQTSPGFHTQIVGITVHELLAFDFRNWKEERGLTSLPEYQPSLLQHDGPTHKATMRLCPSTQSKFTKASSLYG